MHLVFPLLCLSIAVVVQSDSEWYDRDRDVESVPHLPLKTTEAFYFSINEVVFNNSDFVADDGIIKYRPSLLSMPDLPKWMKFSYSDYYLDGFIYGVPEKEDVVTIEVIATNTETFQTRRHLVLFEIMEREVTSRYEVQMKFSNLNVEDMFIGDRLERLLDIFSSILWKDKKENFYVTLLESALSHGGRRPPNPKEKDGVVVRIGALKDFSRELKNLEREVQSIRNREPCPKNYTRTAAERFFRDELFIPDWCGFRLLSDGRHAQITQEPSFQPILLTSNGFNPPAITSETRDLLADFLLCIILPTVLASVLAAALSMIMFGRREGVEKRNRETPSMQMVQYASIHRASNNLRTLTAKRDGPTPAATTPSSTLPRSYASSPTNTLPKGNTIKKSDEKMTSLKSNPSPYGFPGHNLESPQKTVA